MPLHLGTPNPKVWTWPVASNTTRSPRVTLRGTTVNIHTTGVAVPVLSAGPGVVRLATAHPHGRVVVDHGERSTYYVGLAEVCVSRGDQVGAAQAVGTVNGPLGFAIWRYGTPGSAVDPRPYLAAWPLLRGLPNNRNASWWAVKTPGVILAEMNITNADVSAIGRDIYATFRQPWEAEYDKARARFRTERGRDPGVGKDSDPAAEWATVYGWMTPRPSAEDIRWKTYQGAFVHSWGEFEREWLAWYTSNKGTYARMWRGTYDQALDYRKRARQWREQFQALGGVPSAPAPHIPVEGGPFGDLSLSRIAVIAGVVVGAAVAGPPILRALQKERAS